MADENLPQPRRPRNDLAAEYVREILDYDPETGAFRWKWRSDVPLKWNARFAGKIAGSTTPKGYRLIAINRHFYHAHRLAWLYVTGAWPPADLDHRDLRYGNNIFRNLREATRGQNMCNTGLRSDNTSGFKGVQFRAQCTSRPWKAVIRAAGRAHHLGYFPTPEEAAAAYETAAIRLHGEFARTTRHSEVHRGAAADSVGAGLTEPQESPQA